LMMIMSYIARIPMWLRQYNNSMVATSLVTAHVTTII
jgi:hypothetical protein